ncbi:hypothetical protein AVEN_60887-1 [Araneus ventricosus]|uniref:Uncharacterized protein n=1 Tax=Araneus ventricosus TaxID=182803 RepID=A0A4Y2AQ08_ARAVE|nr:hypothetical protein AVEN_60887-1 [Araneus ventricosus]
MPDQVELEPPLPLHLTNMLDQVELEPPLPLHLTNMLDQVELEPPLPLHLTNMLDQSPGTSPTTTSTNIDQAPRAPTHHI